MGTAGSWYDTLNAIHSEEILQMPQADISILDTPQVRMVLRLRAMEQGTLLTDEQVHAVLEALDWMQKSLENMKAQSDGRKQNG